jgi:hypothetical protein
MKKKPTPKKLLKVKTSGIFTQEKAKPKQKHPRNLNTRKFTMKEEKTNKTTNNKKKQVKLNKQQKKLLTRCFSLQLSIFHLFLIFFFFF